MRRYGNLYKNLVSNDNIELAYHNARKGKGWQMQVQKVDKDKERLLQELHESLVNHTFHTSEYRTKKIYEPKEERRNDCQKF